MNASPTVDAAITPMRIILGAMAVGLVGLTTAAAVVVASQPPQGKEQLAAILLAVLGALALMEPPAYFLVRSGQRAKLRQALAQTSAADPLSEILRVSNSLTLIGAAMAEGVGIFGGTIYLITGHAIGIAGPIAALLVLSMLFPSKQKVRVLAIDHLGLDRGSRLIP